MYIYIYQCIGNVIKLCDGIVYMRYSVFFFCYDIICKSYKFRNKNITNEIPNNNYMKYTTAVSTIPR